MDLESLFQSSPDSWSCFTEPGIFEIERFGGGKPRLLIELPHGATARRHFEDLRSRLTGDDLPDDLIAFFFVNTDIGTPECAREIARQFSEPETGEARSAMVLRSLIPRTFIDCNRAVDAGAGDFLEAGVTQAIPDYIRDPRDLELLISMHASYQETADRAYRAICGENGVAVALHSYAPRSVDIDRVDGDIVRALRHAYRPENWSRWPERPEVDVLDRDVDGRELSAESLVQDLLHGFEEAGIEARQNATYRLHPATSAYRHAKSYPERVLCIEFRRDLLADPFDPFEPMQISDDKVSRICSPLIDALRRFSGPRSRLPSFRA